MAGTLRRVDRARNAEAGTDFLEHVGATASWCAGQPAFFVTQSRRGLELLCLERSLLALTDCLDLILLAGHRPRTHTLGGACQLVGVDPQFAERLTGDCVGRGSEHEQQVTGVGLPIAFVVAFVVALALRPWASSVALWVALWVAVAGRLVVVPG